MKRIVLLLFLSFSGIVFSQTNEKTVDTAVSLLTEVNAYPNPFKDKTTIFFTTEQSETISVTIQNLLGKIVYSKKISASEGKNTIDFYKNRLAEGVYLYTIANNKNKITKRLVIK